jgi:2-(1,2-epoxy-1,2-dihydrophenyl)acetyl-CoA isomerase
LDTLMTGQDATQTVSYQVFEGIAHLELDRAPVSNAIDLATAEAFGDAVDLAAADEAVRAVLVTGRGPRFCAGGDLASMLAADDRGPYVEKLARTLDDSFRRLALLEKPIVAGVRGAVAGAGLALMLHCDLVVAGSGTRFVTAYSAVGLTPDCGLSWLLPRAIGQQRALDLLLGSRVLGATQALEWGLVTETVPDDDVTERARAVAVTLAQGPASALGQTRRLVRSAWEVGRAESGADEARTIGRAVVADEATRLLARRAK